MRVLLIIYDNSSYMSYFPLGLAYIAAVLINNGHECDIWDESIYHYSQDQLKAKIESSDYDYIGLSMCGGYYQFNKLVELSSTINSCSNRQSFQYLIGGHMSAADPDYFLKKTLADICVIGEGEQTIISIVDKKPLDQIPGITYRINNNVFKTPTIDLIKDIDTIPFPAWEKFNLEAYRMIRMPNCGPTDFCFPILSARGCVATCLTGDTLVDTLEYGKQPISQLVGKNIKVLTRDKDTHKIIYAQARNVSLTKENTQLIRVGFTNGEHISCTPDHKFKVFSAGNQHRETYEIDIEAKDLKFNQRVRAVCYSKDSAGYNILKYGRGQRIRHQRLVMEGLLNRKLKIKEHVHHLDLNKSNDNINNLVVTTAHIKEYHNENIKVMHLGWKEGKWKHPPMTEENRKKVSERMKLNNPVKNMTPEWRKKLKIAITGKKRTLEQRINYRNSKLKDKNPNYKHGNSIDYMSRLGKEYINHKVLNVEYLENKADVYCMEVPGYDWFFANDVLVHNCNFCYRLDKGIRTRSPGNILQEMLILNKKWKINYFTFGDELFTSNPKKVRELCEMMISSGIPGLKWDCNARVDTVNPEMLQLMKKAGCTFINYGIESVDDTVLKNMNKRTTHAQQVKAVEATIAAGISPGLNIIWGNIEDSIESLQKGVDFLIKYDDGAQVRTIRPVTPYPGSPLFDYCVSNGLIKDVADFYENKHKNSDLFTCDIMGIGIEAATDALFFANKQLLENYHRKKLAATIHDASGVYFLGQSFRGFRV